LREHDLTERLSAFNATTWLHQRGVERKTDERLVALFCYEPPALRALLAQWAASAEPTRLLVTAGRASTAVQAAIAQQNSLEPSWNKRKALSISYIPQLSQYDFDHLLWACDLNFVRGEDSLVRALWAGKPLVWQIYPQDDAAHHAKLEAFLDMLAADPSLRRLHRVWNGMEPGSALDLPTLTHLKTWSETLRSAHDRLLQHPDLATQMLSFVQKKR
jgi:uncharacterized repeat protein (TIGR03837 family)